MFGVIFTLATSFRSHSFTVLLNFSLTHSEVLTFPSYHCNCSHIPLRGDSFTVDHPPGLEIRTAQSEDSSVVTSSSMTSPSDTNMLAQTPTKLWMWLSVTPWQKKVMSRLIRCSSTNTDFNLHSALLFLFLWVCSWAFCVFCVHLV